MDGDCTKNCTQVPRSWFVGFSKTWDTPSGGPCCTYPNGLEVRPGTVDIPGCCVDEKNWTRNGLVPLLWSLGETMRLAWFGGFAGFAGFGRTDLFGPGPVWRRSRTNPGRLGAREPP